MQQEIIEIINVLKQANEFVYPAALHAAKVGAYMQLFIGSGVIAVIILCICLFYKSAEGEDLHAHLIVTGVFFLFIAFMVVAMGIYGLNTLEYQAFKMLIAR